MRALDLIVKKRNGAALNDGEIDFLVRGCVDSSIPEYQIAAWLMAVYFKGMSFEETACLTRHMIGSGAVIDLDEFKAPLVDKHSTGGVGDKVSLVLAPLAAACGLVVPMMSGRSLGHTGGTLDKLESIPGYRVRLAAGEFRAVLREAGFAMIGQTADLVPADRRLYSLRDATGTVESIPLITASILSKKFAEGARSLVFDVKCGDGAFMKTPQEAGRLARSLVDTARGLDRRVAAVITGMDQPLGRKVGNFLEVEESLDCLEGRGPADLMELTLRLAGWMLVAGGLAGRVEEGVERASACLATGKPREFFMRNVAAQGGDARALEKLRGAWRAPLKAELRAERTGFVASIEAYKTGLAAVHLGAGRSRAEDSVRPDVGIELLKKAGEPVQPGELCCVMYGAERDALERARRLMSEAYHFGGAAEAPARLILEEISAL